MSEYTGCIRTLDFPGLMPIMRKAFEGVIQAIDTVLPNRLWGFWSGLIDEDDENQFFALVSKRATAYGEHYQIVFLGQMEPNAPVIAHINPELYWESPDDDSEEKTDEAEDLEKILDSALDEFTKNSAIPWEYDRPDITYEIIDSDLKLIQENVSFVNPNNLSSYASETPPSVIL